MRAGQGCPAYLFLLLWIAVPVARNERLRRDAAPNHDDFIENETLAFAKWKPSVGYHIQKNRCKGAIVPDSQVPEQVLDVVCEQIR